MRTLNSTSDEIIYRQKFAILQTQPNTSQINEHPYERGLTDSMAPTSLHEVNTNFLILPNFLMLLKADFPIISLLLSECNNPSKKPYRLIVNS